MRGNRVVGAWRIGGHQRVNEGKVRFHLREDPVLGGWAGHDSPVKWRRGQANPVAYAEGSANPPEANKSAGAATHRRTPAAARRRTHRITIETYDLGDDAAARLHHTLLTVAGLTGKLCDCRATSLVGEIERAKTELNYNYSSAANPPALRGQVSGSRG